MEHRHHLKPTGEKARNMLPGRRQAMLIPGLCFSYTMLSDKNRKERMMREKQGGTGKSIPEKSLAVEFIFIWRWLCIAICIPARIFKGCINHVCRHRFIRPLSNTQPMPSPCWLNCDSQREFSLFINHKLKEYLY